MTDANKDSLIAAKNNRIKKLEEENKRLKDELLKLRKGIVAPFVWKNQMKRENRPRPYALGQAPNLSFHKDNFCEVYCVVRAFQSLSNYLKKESFLVR